MGSRIGIDFISVMGMPPVDFIALAADLGCSNIGLAPQPIVSNPYNFPEWSLLGNPALQRDVAGALREHKVTISLGEGFLVRPGADIADAAPLFDLMAELGAQRVNVASIEVDRTRNFDQIAQFARMAAERGLSPVLEFAPIMAVTNLSMALEALAYVDQPGFAILVDALHLFRSGGTVADVAALDPSLIGYVQLCDGPAEWTQESYLDEARFHRLCPGTGAFPLKDLVAAVPDDIILGLEIPMQNKALAGVSPREYLSECVAGAKALL
jgi:sugar phosphate isomerase/epimerase